VPIPTAHELSAVSSLPAGLVTTLVLSKPLRARRQRRPIKLVAADAVFRPKKKQISHELTNGNEPGPRAPPNPSITIRGLVQTQICDGVASKFGAQKRVKCAVWWMAIKQSIICLIGLLGLSGTIPRRERSDH
jgi:hypothetical protein